jgi:hypothetical protein
MAAPLLALGGEREVGTVETVDELLRVFHAQLRADIGACARIGGGGGGDAGHVRKRISQATQRAIVRPEIMAPLADAVRLVDGDQRHLHLLKTRCQRPIRQRLGRDVEQVHLAGRGRADGVGAVFEALA